MNNLHVLVNRFDSLYPEVADALRKIIDEIEALEAKIAELTEANRQAKIKDLHYIVRRA